MSTESVPPRSPFPPIRRVVTGHTPEGKSVVLEDAPIELRPRGKSAAYYIDLFSTDTNPPDNAVDFKDLAKEHSQDPSNLTGSAFLVSDTPPGNSTDLHRTVTLDYCIVMHGSVALLLEDNKRVHLKAGDVVVQRGTVHGWVNEGSEWARMYAVVLPSQKVKIGDKELEAEYST